MLSLDWKNLPIHPQKIWDFIFIDLFAGIGGFQQVFQEAKGKCVFTSEWDDAAQKTYKANFGETPYGHGGSHPYLVHEFVSSVLENRAPAIPVAEAVHYMTMGIAAHRSAQRDGEIVSVPSFD